MDVPERVAALTSPQDVFARLDLVLLADKASLHVRLDIISHPRPVVAILEESVCHSNSKWDPFLC